MKKLVPLCLLGIFIVTVQAEEYRTFTDKEGREVNAKIIKVDARSNRITIERDDKRQMTVSTTIFSDTDQQYIQEWLAASAFYNNAKLRVTVDLKKDKKDKSTDLFRYKIKLHNKTNLSLEAIEIRYVIFIKIDGTNGAEDKKKLYLGRLDFGDLEQGLSKEILTDSTELKKTFKSDRITAEQSREGGYKPTLKKVSEEKVTGIWLKIYGPEVDGEQVSRSVCMPGGLDQHFTWPPERAFQNMRNRNQVAVGAH